MKKIKAIKYKLKVYEGALAWTHGWSKEIEEIFIPDKKIAFNVGDGSIHVFRSKEPREKNGEEIEIEDMLAQKLEEYITIGNTLRDQVGEILKKKEKV